jgi:hypothetical protein
LQKQTKFWTAYFRFKGYIGVKFDKNGLAYILGDFSTFWAIFQETQLVTRAYMLQPG